MTDWHDYFLTYRKQMDLAKRGITNQYLDDGQLVIETIEPAPATELMGSEDLDPATLVRSPKSIYQKAVDLGWELISLRQSQVWHFDAFMQADGKPPKRGGERKLAGDLKKAAYMSTEVYMTVVSRTVQAGFVAAWDGGSFREVVMHDRVGFPIPIYRSYRTIDENGLGKTAYVDDGEDFVVHKLATQKFGDLTAWLDDWLRILNPSKAPPLPEPEAPPAPEPLTKGIWIEHD